MARFASLLTTIALAVACGDDVASTDAGVDGGRDGGRDAGRDGGPVCDPTCAPAESCCGAPGGGAACANTFTDIANCGICGRNCAAGRGTVCEAARCVCGTVESGCGGARGSWCCPPRADGGVPYCANFDQDPNDCGGCGVACDPARSSQCVTGTCLCGTERRACAGTPEDSCCADAVGMYACHDVTSDLLHCGACAQPCAGDRCENGVCTIGASCSTPCGAGEICCRGECCAAVLCARGECGLDGGT